MYFGGGEKGQLKRWTRKLFDTFKLTGELREQKTITTIHYLHNSCKTVTKFHDQFVKMLLNN